MITNFRMSPLRAELTFSPCGCRIVRAPKSKNTIEQESVLKHTFSGTNRKYVADPYFEKWRPTHPPTAHVCKNPNLLASLKLQSRSRRHQSDQKRLIFIQSHHKRTTRCSKTTKLLRFGLCAVGGFPG